MSKHNQTNVASSSPSAPPNLQLEFYPQERIFSASIGCLIPFVADLGAHLAAASDLHAINFDFDYSSLNYPEFRWDNQFSESPMPGLLSHKHIDEAISIDTLNSQLLPNKFFKNNDFRSDNDFSREAANQLLIGPIPTAHGNNYHGDISQISTQIEDIGNAISNELRNINQYNFSDTIPNVPPIAVLDMPDMASSGVATMIDGALSHDVDGNIVQYTFDFGDGQYYSEGLSSSPDGKFDGKVEHEFADAGTYKIKLTVTDNKGATDFTYSSITILNDAPDAVNDGSLVSPIFTNEDTGLIIHVLDNDTDPNKNPLAVTTFTAASHGKLTLNPDNTILYTPDANYHGADQFTYTITDGLGKVDTATVFVGVNSINDIPVAVDDLYTTKEDTALIIAAASGILANDTDLDVDTLSVASYKQPSNGFVSVGKDGSLTYNPNKDFYGVDTFTYTVSDENGGTADATVTINVSPVDDPVDAVDDNASTNEEQAVNIFVLSNDTDFGDGYTLSVTNTSTPSHGTTFINPDGSIAYTPNKDFFGTDSFTYTMTDGKGNFDIATVQVVVNPIDDAVDAIDDNAVTSEDSPVYINVLGNDTDFGDGDALTISGTGSALHGSVAIVSGQILYTPDSNYNGLDSFTYTMTDGKGNFDTATVNLTINSINDPPVAVNDSVVTNEDTAVTINVLSNDTDVDIATNGDVISIQSVGTPSNGTAVISSGQIKYTPNLNYFGTDSFTYTITDKAGLTSTATVDVTINSINDPPVAVNDSVVTNEDTAVTINVLSNDTDVDIATNGDVISIQSVGTPSNGTAVISSGQIKYTPNLNYFGTDSFTYTITDKAGLTSTATVNLTINPVNDPPVAVNDSATTAEDTPITINVLANDSDVDIPTNGDVISIQSVGTPSNGTAIISAGQILYTPKANFNGVDSFTYTITDKAGLTSTATVNLTINPVNDPPVAVNDSVVTNEDTAVTINVLANDSDVDIATNGDVISIQSVGTPSNGTAVISSGQILYTPKANFNGTDSFTYTITDKAGLTSTATVNLTINPVNDPPVAVNDSVVTNEDTAVTINVLSNDTDVDIATNGDVISIQSVGTPSNGTAVISAGQILYTPKANFNGTDSFTYTITDKAGLTSTATVNLTINPVNDSPVAVNDSVVTNEDTAVTINVLSNDTDVDIATNGDVISIQSVGTPSNGTAVISAGQILYTPKANFNGVDSFTYTIQDKAGLTSTATVNLTITAVNDPPVAVNDSVVTNEDTAVTINVLSNDSDVDLATNGDVISIQSVGTPSNGTAVISSGQIKYTPNLNYFGTDSFTYTITDKAGLTSTATVDVTINSINDPPVAVNDSAITNEDTAVTINVLSNDTDPDIATNGDAISIKSVGTPTNGTAVISSGQILYTPKANFNGVDSFTYTVQDTAGSTSTATVTVTVNPINDPPVAVNDSKSTNEDTAVTINVLSNDTDVDIATNADVISIQSVGTPSNGTAVISSGQIKYTPNLNYNGADSFTYTITDKAGLTSTATVNITVNAINDAPKAVNDAATTNEDTAVTINVLSNDTDVDIATNADVISIKSVGSPTNGTAVISSGQILYTPKANFNGTDSFTYTIQDKAGSTSTATVTVTVNPINDPPVAVNDIATTNEDTAVTINVLSNDTDVDIATNADVISIQSVGIPSNGTAVISAGKILYTPNLNYFGTDSFTYTITDKAGLTSTATVNVTINSVNDAPDAIDDSGTTVEDTPLSFNVLNGTASAGKADSDPVEGSIVSVSKYDATSTQGGTVSINTTTGATIYTPKTDFFGTDTFTYQITDGQGGFDTATVTITVVAADDAPRPQPDLFTFNEDTVKTFTTADLLANDIEVDNGKNTFVSYDGSSIKYGNLAFDSGTGTFTYTPNPNYNNNGPFGLNTPGGTQYDTFTYTVKDDTGNLVNSTVTLNVLPINDPPVAVNDNITINEDTVTTMNILDGSLSSGNPDSDPVEQTAIVIKSLGTPSNGTVSIVNASTGQIKYTPNTNYNGNDQFTYVIKDADGGLSTGTVFVTINPVNDPPTAVNDSFTTNTNTKLTFTTTDIIKNDIEVDGENINFVSYDGTNIKNGVLAFNSGTGTFDYTPNTSFYGTETFTYTVKDDTSNFATATVTIVVNDPPVAFNDSKSTLEDTPLIINVASNDTDADKDTLTVSSVGKASHGTVSFSGSNITYTPDLNYNNNGVNGSNAGGGTQKDSFLYTITDGKGGFSTATVTVDILPVNDVPVAINDSAITLEDTQLKFNVIDGSSSSGKADSDPVEGEGISISTYDAISVNKGTVSIDKTGNVTYTPFLNFNGTDSFTYTIVDASGGLSTATATIIVTPVNDAPTPVNDGVTTFEDTAVTFAVIPNDSDVDKDPFIIISNTNPSNGTVTLNGLTQRFTYTPNTNYNGTDSFTYTIKDPSGLTGTATVNLTVTALNDAPVATLDSITTTEDTPISINVIGNDFDVDLGDTITLNSVTQPQFGTTSINKDGTVLYTPNLDFNGNDQFTYKIVDSQGAFSIGTVSVTVTPVNDPPIAIVDNRSTFEDTAITINVISNDSDVEKDALTVISAGTASNGTVQIIGNQIKYTPNANYNGNDSFTYTIKDPAGLTSAATVNMIVIPLNDSPIALVDSISTNEDTAVTIDVLANDSDPDTILNGDTISIVSANNGSKGNVSIVANKILYTPKADVNGIDTFTYTIKDSFGLTSTATVTVNIVPVQDAPVAVNDGFTASNLTVAKADTPITINVLANDYDVDGDSLSVVAIPSSPSHGGVVINGDNTISYTPTIGYIGLDTFTYKISDGNGNFSTATVTMSVGTSNSSPSGNSDSATTPEDTAVTINVLQNDIDPEGDKLTVIYSTNGAHGSTSINPDGTIVYTPNANYFGSDTFIYRTNDGNGNFVNSIVTVTITPVQDPPNAVNDSITTNEDTPITINVLGNDGDPDGDTVTIVAGSVSTPINGTAVISSGKILYTPNSNYNGSDSFTYKITDGNGNFDTATVNISVASVVDAPIAVNDAVATNEDTPISFNVFTNDTNPDGATLLLGTTTSVSHGTLSLDSKGNATYTPEKDYNGLDSFNYSIFDQYGNISNATVNITVNSVNDSPIAVSDTASTNEDTAVIINVVKNDTDIDNDPLSVLSTTNGSNGSVIINKDGTLTYTPNVNFNGSDSFTYIVKDSSGATSTATVNIAVAPINDNPTPVNDNVTTNEDAAITINVLANDTDLDGNSLVVTNIGTPANGSITLNPDKTITYEPYKDFSGVDTFTYTVNDGYGGSATATVTVTVTNVNDAPVALNDVASTNESTPVIISVLGNDTDSDLIYGDTLTIKSVGTAANGTLTIVNGSTQIQYTPKAFYSGTDSFTYTVQDKAGLTSTATVNVTINAVNSPPVAVNDAATTNEDTAVTINVLANDSDPNLGDTISIKSVGTPSKGTASIVSGKILYTPSLNYNGIDSFSYIIQDSQGATSSATATITVNAINDAPTAQNDISSTNKNVPLVLNFNSLTSNDTDPDIGDSLTIASVSNPVNGVVTINFLSNSITYTPTINFVGPGSFQYTVTDGNGGTSVATVTITVI